MKFNYFGHFMLRGWTCLFYDKTINNEYLTMTHIYLYYYIGCVFKLFPEVGMF